jgi:diguanylate cyclase (GGDEF)-like protein/PAS domain S-box-containing protein
MSGIPDRADDQARRRQLSSKDDGRFQNPFKDSPSRETASADIPLRGGFLTSRDWNVMAPGMLVSGILLGVSVRSTPPLIATALWSLAIGIAALGKVFAGFERRQPSSRLRRLLCLTIGIGGPALLFGSAIALWTSHDPAVPWISSAGLLASIGLLAAILLSGRMLSIATVSAALWLPLVLLEGNALSFSVLLSGIAGSALAMVRNMRIEREQRAEQHARERVQARALEILVDYEETGQGWFWETDAAGAITYISSTIGAMLGRPVEALIGQPLGRIFDFDVAGRGQERMLSFHMATRSYFHDLALRAAATGEERWWSVSGRPMHDAFDNFVGFRGFGSDLTERRRSEATTTRLAHFDSLTGLANRFQMSQILEKLLRAQRPDRRACTILLLDLDRFKQVNDTLGHPAGDALLKQVAQRLDEAVDKPGRLGRLGGDEFQIVVPGRTDRKAMAALAQKIIESLARPYTIEGQRVVIGASIGIAVAPDDGQTSEALIRNADLALYAAKDAGRGRHHFYAADLHSDAEERRQLEHDLRDALANGGLELYYQPVVQTTTERITGFEALLRWRHPALGPLPPSKFIPIAEDAGLIAPIGEWALRTACHDLARWPDRIHVAVNVSALQFSNSSLPAIVTSALASAQVDPSRLELEITESVFLADVDGLDATFASLKRIGVKLALDDFGTGYSALGYLKKAPFDRIKIDQSFVRGATLAGSRNGAIMAAIVSLAEALGMETTAEGVETLDELDLIRMLGCSHVQGFIYERPLDVEAASACLRAGLILQADGRRSTGTDRPAMVRKAVIEHAGRVQYGTIRNVSAGGAMIEGLWNVAPGAVVGVHMADGSIAEAIARWCQDGRTGVEFSARFHPEAIADSGYGQSPLDLDAYVRKESCPSPVRVSLS